MFWSTIVSSALFASVFFVSFIGILLYRKAAVRMGILANSNFRTLHKFPTPKAGGIVFALVFVISVFLLRWLDQLSDELFWLFGIGGGSAALFGLLDDVKDEKRNKRNMERRKSTVLV